MQITYCYPCLTNTVPMKGDIIKLNDCNFYEVTQRRLFYDNHNFIIIHVEAN